jgi:hypothetical protein
VTPDVVAFKQRTSRPRGEQGLLVLGNYQGQLSARGETLRLLSSSGREVRSNNYVGQPSAAQQFLRVTEIMFNPAGAADLVGREITSSAESQGFLTLAAPNEEATEFIELKNTGSAQLDLRGVRFAEGVQFNFSDSGVTNLTGGESVVVVKNLAAFIAQHGGGVRVAGEYIGSLENNGERLQLLDADGEEILDFDYDDDWYPVTDGLGFSLVTVDERAEPDAWNQKSNWRPGGVFGGSPSVNNPPSPEIASVIINEVLSNSDAPVVDAVELHNPTATPANIGGWFISDDRSLPKKFRIPDETLIPVGGFVIFTEANFNGLPESPLNFAFSSDGDEAWLFSADAAGNLTGYAHGFRFGPAETGISFGRHITSVGEEDFVAQVAITLNATNAGPKVGPIVISEIMYHPVAADVKKLISPLSDTVFRNLVASAGGNELGEFIEVQNISANSVALFDPQRPTNTGDCARRWTLSFRRISSWFRARWFCSSALIRWRLLPR